MRSYKHSPTPTYCKQIITKPNDMRIIDLPKRGDAVFYMQRAVEPVAAGVQVVVLFCTERYAIL